MLDITIPGQETHWSSNFDVGRTKPIDLIVVHSTRGPAKTLDAEYQSTINFCSGPNSNSNASAHYVVGPVRCCRMVHDKDRSWNARYLNAEDLGMEIAQPDWEPAFTETEYQLAAKIAGGWCHAHNIPDVHIHVETGRGIIGHEETAQGKGEKKSDPGSKFDWAHFMTLVNAEYHRLTAPPPPIVHGPNIPAITANMTVPNQATGAQEAIGSGFAAMLVKDKTLGEPWFISDVVVPSPYLPDKLLYCHATKEHAGGAILMWRRGPNECRVLPW